MSAKVWEARRWSKSYLRTIMKPSYRLPGQNHFHESQQAYKKHAIKDVKFAGGSWHKEVPKYERS